MTKTNKKTLEEIIRVDHAGERGAIKIYEGQLLALKTFKQDEFLKKKIEEMKEHEKEHYEYFDDEIKKRNIQPTKLLPLWDLMGVALGFGTAMLGQKAAMNIEMNLDITINLLDKNGNKLSYVDLKIFKSQELGDNISLLEKEYLIQEMLRSLIKDFDSLAINKLKEIFYKNLLPN